MAVLVATNHFFSINAVDLSDHCTKLTFTVGAAEIDITAMGDSWEEVTAGLKNWSLNATLQQDYASAKVDATLWPLVGTTTTVIGKPVNAATSATNPQYSGTVLITEYTPIDGSVGELSVVTFTWKGSGALARATA